MNKDNKGEIKLEDSGEGLLPVAERHSLEWNRREQNAGNGEICRTINT